MSTVENQNQNQDQNRTAEPPAPTVWPALAARDALAMIDFLERAFGFRPVVVMAEDGFVQHAELAWPEGGGIMMGSEKHEGNWQQKPGTFGAYVVCSDPDALYDRAKAAGATITMEPTTTDYGSRDFIAEDPEGNSWSFGTYRGEPH
ncbi:VOC family protein [Mumia sp. zg.B53]|uniref:VOC family protein n=1 Tax=unclassified Mumia TaxID=2621872 RepID=UPI001C6EE7E6|nr:MULTISPECIES: VOC family protein [unclassified Mumia]MBW9208089.1 VOC family protein [Mumia sp. zg.B21]MBW9216043.1 VOC family protein [Mumia sp. zg.B53]MDD9349520.1 VOC family protein [Mumia sp.]